MRRRSFRRRMKRKSVWLALVNFTVDAPGAADRSAPIIFSAPLATGTRVAFAATVLSATGVAAAVGGESGKTRRIVGDVVVSAIIDGGNTVSDLYVREAIMYCEVTATGAVLLDDVDLFSNFVQGGENIVAQRQIYLGAVDTVGAVVRPNIYHQWFQEGGYARWDFTNTRRLDSSHVLVYVVCIKRQAGLIAPALIMAGELRGIIVK